MPGSATVGPCLDLPLLGSVLSTSSGPPSGWTLARPLSLAFPWLGSMTGSATVDLRMVPQIGSSLAGFCSKHFLGSTFGLDSSSAPFIGVSVVRQHDRLSYS